MSRSVDPGHFFQTTDALAQSDRKTAKSKNKNGNPIKLPSKILAACADPTNTRRLYTAEAAGTVRRVVLEDADTSHVYSGPSAPLTCLAVSKTSVFAGCWDKSIWSWDIETRKLLRKYTGHADFVKALAYVQLDGRELLISGGSDAAVIVWDTASGEQLHKSKAHTRGILALKVDPATLPESSSAKSTSTDGHESSITLFSADTTRDVRRWRLNLSSLTEISVDPLVVHETSVYALHFDSDGDLWTASADKTAKCLSRDHDWAQDMSLAHPDFVKDIVTDDEGGWVLTACRDEEVRVWEKGSGKCWLKFTGHFEEVTALALLGKTLVSVSIDATIRQWSLELKELQKAREEALKAKDGENVEVAEEKKESLLTEEEERELAELMEDDDD